MKDTSDDRGVYRALCKKYQVSNEVQLWRVMDVMDKVKLVMAERSTGVSPYKSYFS